MIGKILLFLVGMTVVIPTVVFCAYVVIDSIKHGG